MQKRLFLLLFILAISARMLVSGGVDTCSLKQYDEFQDHHALQVKALLHNLDDDLPSYFDEDLTEKTEKYLPVPGSHASTLLVRSHHAVMVRAFSHTGLRSRQLTELVVLYRRLLI